MTINYVVTILTVVLAGILVASTPPVTVSVYHEQLFARPNSPRHHYSGPESEVGGLELNITRVTTVVQEPPQAFPAPEEVDFGIHTADADDIAAKCGTAPARSSIHRPQVITTLQRGDSEHTTAVDAAGTNTNHVGQSLGLPTSSVANHTPRWVQV